LTRRVVSLNSAVLLMRVRQANN